MHCSWLMWCYTTAWGFCFAFHSAAAPEWGKKGLASKRLQEGSWSTEMVLVWGPWFILSALCFLFLCLSAWEGDSKASWANSGLPGATHQRASPAYSQAQWWAHLFHSPWTRRSSEVSCEAYSGYCARTCLQGRGQEHLLELLGQRDRKHCAYFLPPAL